MSEPERASYTCPKCRAISYNPNDVRELYCVACHTFAEQLRDEPVTEFAALTKLHLTKRDCFSLAILTIAREQHPPPEARLVHGFVRDSFHPESHVLHAWCEWPGLFTFENESGAQHQAPGTVVIDFSQLDERCRFMPRDLMYERCGVQLETLRFYTRDEAIARGMATGHDGPWDFPEDAP